MSASSSEELIRTVNGGGNNSFSYSTTSGSSNSSSVENISTSSSIENGDQLTITFVSQKLPSSRGVIGSLLQDIFSVEDEACLLDDDRVSPVCSVAAHPNKSFCGRRSLSPASSTPSSASPWYDSGIKTSASSLHKTLTNEENDRPSSSSSSYSQVIQHLSGDGILLRSLEKGGIDKFASEQRVELTSLDLKYAQVPYLHLSTNGFCVPPCAFLRDNGDVKQGVYKEIKRVVPPDSWIKLDCHQDHGKSTWLFLGFKTLDKNNEVLEQSWKEWTGVRHLYLELQTDIHIRRISFFRRRDPLECLDTFTYVVFIEIGSISGKTNRWLIDFVQRARLERMHSTMIVYEEIELWDADSGIH